MNFNNFSKSYCLGSIIFLFASLQQVFAQAPTPNLASTECKEFVAATLTEVGWTGAVIQVPLDWNKPNDKKIEVYAYYDARKDLAKSTPVLFLNGGPVSHYHARVKEMHARVNQYDPNGNYIFVMMDQRGTGCSVPVIPYENQPIEELAKFGSDQIIHDAEAIRKKLFPNKKWKIFGQSYGGTIAKRYVANYPESTSEVHIFDSAWHQTMKDFFLFRILKQIRVFPKFTDHFKNDPQVEEAIQFILDKRNSSTLCTFINPEIGDLCGKVLLQGILAGVGNGKGPSIGSTENWDKIASNLKAVLLPETREKFYQAAKSGLSFFTTGNSIMRASVWSRDQDLVNGNYDFDCTEAEATLKTKYQIDPEQLPFNECIVITQAIPQSSKKPLQGKITNNPDQITPARLKEVLAKNQQIPFYLYSAELGTSALEESLVEYIAIPEVQYTSVPDVGHGAWSFHPEVWGRLMGYPVPITEAAH